MVNYPLICTHILKNIVLNVYLSIKKIIKNREMWNHALPNTIKIDKLC